MQLEVVAHAVEPDAEASPRSAVQDEHAAHLGHAQQFGDLAELAQPGGQGLDDLAQSVQGAGVRAHGRAHTGVAQHRLGGEPVALGGPPTGGGEGRVVAEDLLDPPLLLVAHLGGRGQRTAAGLVPGVHERHGGLAIAADLSQHLQTGLPGGCAGLGQGTGQDGEIGRDTRVGFAVAQHRSQGLKGDLEFLLGHTGGQPEGFLHCLREVVGLAGGGVEHPLERGAELFNHPRILSYPHGLVVIRMHVHETGERWERRR